MRLQILSDLATWP